MEQQYHYATVSEAINQLRQKGFTMDFNLDGNYINSKENRFQPDEFEIVDTYRYEGDTDPADEATVYGIESKTGIKGILVTGYGMYNDNASTHILQKLGKHQIK